MLSRPVRPLLYILHTVIFAALLLKRRFGWLLSTGWRHAISAAATSLGFVNSSATEQRSIRRGKQPKPPRALAVILADSDNATTPLRQLAFLVSWCGAMLIAYWRPCNAETLLGFCQGAASHHRCIRRDINTLFVYHPQGTGHHAPSCMPCTCKALCALAKASTCTIQLQRRTDRRAAEAAIHPACGKQQRQSGGAGAEATMLISAEPVYKLDTEYSRIAGTWICAWMQAGFGANRNGKGSAKPDHTCPDDGGRPAPACVHLLNAEDARWPLAHAACTVDGMRDSATDADLHPAAALHSQLVRAAGTAAAVEPDIALVSGAVAWRAQDKHSLCDASVHVLYMSERKFGRVQPWGGTHSTSSVQVQVCGKAFTLAGFPPWLLRFGELYHLGDLRDVTDERLRTFLQKYSSVAQRFGT